MKGVKKALSVGSAYLADQRIRSGRSRANQRQPVQTESKLTQTRSDQFQIRAALAAGIRESSAPLQGVQSIRWQACPGEPTYRYIDTYIDT